MEKLIVFLISIFNIITLVSSEEIFKINEDIKESPSGHLLTAEVYAKVFSAQRIQHNRLIKEMLQNSYEKNYKLLDVAFSKIFQILQQNNETLCTEKYSSARDGFPKKNKHMQEVVTTTLENCCLSAEITIHFPEISYRIFKKVPYPKWKESLNWCIEFAFALQHIIDESTIKLMDLLAQEINLELRRADYVNPYYKIDEENLDTPSRKEKPKCTKKLNKGPQLSGAGHNEL